MPARKRGVGFVFQHYAAFKHMTVRDERRVRADDPQAAEGRDRAARRRAARARAARRASRSATRRSSPAASGSAWRSPARSRSSRRCCCSTSRSARSTHACARSCATGCGGCTTRCTSRRSSSRTTRRRRWRWPTQIVVMNEGRDRAGRLAARPLRASPANEFVMSFVGPVNQLGGARCGRTTSSCASSRTGRREEAMVERVVHLGFEVRVELWLGDGGELRAQVTRDEAERAGARRGLQPLRQAPPHKKLRLNDGPARVSPVCRCGASRAGQHLLLGPCEVRPSQAGLHDHEPVYPSDGRSHRLVDSFQPAVAGPLDGHLRGPVGNPHFVTRYVVETPAEPAALSRHENVHTSRAGGREEPHGTGTPCPASPSYAGRDRASDRCSGNETAILMLQCFCHAPRCQWLG